MLLFSFVRRELRCAARSMMAWVEFAAFVGASMALFMVQLRLNDGAIVTVPEVFVRTVVVTLPAYIVLVTMRSFAEEERRGTLEVLLTSPLPDTAIVFSKFVTGMVLAFLALCGLFVSLGLYLRLLPDPPLVTQAGMLWAFLCLAVYAATWLAMGLWASLVSRHQATAAVLALVLMLPYALLTAGQLPFLPPLTYCDALGILPFARGLADSRPLLLALSLCALFLFFAVQRLAVRRCPPRRRWTLLNHRLTLVLALALCVLANVISSRLYLRTTLAPLAHGALSDQTVNLLRRTEGPITLIAFLNRDHPLSPPVNALLRHFAEASKDIPGVTISIAIVDPFRDVAHALDIAARYHADANCVIVATDYGTQILTEDELLCPVTETTEDAAAVEFVGEAAVTAAIWRTARPDRPAVYFLSGHGEYDPDSYDPLAGYSIAARHLRLKGYAVTRLAVAQNTLRIPENCSLLVIAGARTAVSPLVAERINTYLTTGGRLMLLLDPATDAGLGAMLSHWRIYSRPGMARDDATLRIESAPTTGEHAIVRHLGAADVTFVQPALIALRATAVEDDAADRPRLAVLVPAPNAAPRDAVASGWVVAAERGSAQPSSEAPLTRLVVSGDAAFAANAFLSSGYNANRDLFLSAV
ncbi:MAG: Gldg family protein, partial [Kiritimatiellaeota bacterium]|nr:Gldg family protein [Kiritimatiellota bacterium]